MSAFYGQTIDSIGFEIKFSSDGQISGTRNTYYGEFINDLPVPEKTGFDFCGWYDSEEYNGEPYQNGEICDLTENKTLYAKWREKQFQISFTGEQSAGLEDKIVTYNHPIGELPNLQREGYTFLGWKTSDGEYYTPDTVYAEVSDITLISAWEAKQYTVTLNPNGGVLTGPADFTVTYDQDFLISAQIRRNGYIFEGWYDSNGLKYATAENEAVRLWDKSEDAILFAQWTAKSYEIQINNDGTITWLGPTGLSDKQCLIEYGTVINAINLISEFKNSEQGYREGRIFDHFEYEDNQINWTAIPDLGENGAIITIVPIWKLEKHTIYFNTQTSIQFEKIEAIYNEDIALPKTVERIGYKFINWFTAAQGETKTTWTKMPDLTPGTQSDGSIMLYAQYELCNYSITYNLDGGTNSANNPSNYTIESIVRLEDPQKTGYMFAGWYTDEDMHDEIIELKNDFGDKVFYAKWLPKTYTVNLDMQGGYGEIKYITVTFGEAMPYLDKPTKTHYVFQGYYTQKNGGGVQFYDADMIGMQKWQSDRDGVLYAYWTGEEYAIIYDNLNFLGKNADVVLDNTFKYAPTKYNYGIGLDFTRVSAFYQPDSPYSPHLIFLGWYSDKSFTTNLREFPQPITGRNTYMPNGDMIIQAAVEAES